RLGAGCHIHIKLETGMNRQGFMPTAENADAIAEISRMPGLVVDGLYTHFPASDDDPAYTANQVRLFDGMVDMLGERGVKIPIRHVSNSAAVMNFPEYGYDMVRAGIILYGVYPFPDADRSFIVLESIESLKAQITYLKVVPPGEKVGYGLSYQTTRETQIATVPIGYADGYSRSLNNIGQCIVQGTIVPIIGKLCMDQLMLDVTGLTPKVGDEVVFMGRQGDAEITIEDIADKIGQIPASVMCSFTKRLPRVYTKGGEICHVLDYLLEL
ncbi:alanine racemase, partial [Ruminococcaceae bacterium OttesenSCG-928-D13]|nr:alanine racemase [Ruminococcaceae bacterium OttesenSCG-928-D13]